MIEKIWNNCSKIDVVALITIFIVGLLGYNLLAAAISIFMAGYHTYKAYNG
jgi:hypothetical protein